LTRAFVGIEIPHAIGQRLTLLRGNLPGARWIDAEDYHLTLRYLGDCDSPTLDEICKALDTIDADAFEMQLSGIGTFGHEKTRSIWIGVANNPALTQLRAAVDSAVRQTGLDLDGRKFTPHITLARLSREKPQAVAEALSAMGNPVIAPITVNRFVLYTSGRSRGGGPYVKEEGFELTPGLDANEAI